MLPKYELIDEQNMFAMDSFKLNDSQPYAGNSKVVKKCKGFITSMVFSVQNTQGP